MKRKGAFHQLFYHFVWGTKNRSPMITAAVEARLWPYIGYQCQTLGYGLYAVNGTADHVHLLLELTPSMVVAEVARNLKGSASHYINKESGLPNRLYWQDGYGVVTLRKTEIPTVKRYIQRQKEHHHSGKLSEILEQTEVTTE